MSSRHLQTTLRRYRLQQGMSYRQLAEDISAARGSRMGTMTVFNFIHGRHRQPSDLTCYSIEQYLKRRAPKGVTV
jgi:transcriptional regulator with XRE-family HTH domain